MIKQSCHNCDYFIPAFKANEEQRGDCNVYDGFDYGYYTFNGKENLCMWGAWQIPLGLGFEESMKVCDKEGWQQKEFRYW